VIPEKIKSWPFYMDAYEVTIGQYKKFLKSSGYKPDDAIDWNGVYEYSPTEKHPMIYVSWHGATAYAKWAGKRLPTEAEWEYAARGGRVGKRYPWGDDHKVARDYANYGGTGGRDKWDRAAPVGSFKPNGYSLYDMAGNVREWCADWYGPDYYSKSPAKNPPGPDTGSSRVLRGGSWNNSTPYLRVATRYTYTPPYRCLNHGFRCVSGLN
ncbi:MAG: SUMF1/EgtB/PvdO family nonheme iron enzyme, partial [Gammaproteobacteria bacterium]|nr:SUMF1/EgtB/PvdO family nonheme iron enzyme [Gammaproteobacteria bacterium]